jgi:hypothetical protein
VVEAVCGGVVAARDWGRPPAVKPAKSPKGGRSPKAAQRRDDAKEAGAAAAATVELPQLAPLPPSRIWVGLYGWVCMGGSWVWVFGWNV